MPNSQDALPIAIRVYPEPKDFERERRSPRGWPLPKGMLVFDTETRIDASQALSFGSYRICWDGRCFEEGIFYGDDLPEKDRRVLEHYVVTHSADTVNTWARKLKLLTRAEFMELLFKFAYKRRYLLVAFNFPFDVARIAFDFGNARGRFAGGFTLYPSSYMDDLKGERLDKHRPAICIKKIDSKRSLKGFASRLKPDENDLIPEGSETGKPEPGHIFRGHFLDLRTLAFALADRSCTLETACAAFGVEHGKQKVARHGIVTDEYIDYNRRDVLATAELAVKLLEEYAKHPIALQATKAYSPASIGKAYLRAMGINPILERQPDFPKRFLGHAQSAFFGGRTSAHIRKFPVPVVMTDFLSMYPTVNGLMGLWRFVTARDIRVVDHCQTEIQKFLSCLSPKDLFNPNTWKNLTVFVKVKPDGDILPSRAKYSAASNDWQVAVNRITAQNDNPKNALWFSLPDIVTCAILTGKIPKIVDAFRIVPVSALPALKTTTLRGAIPVDPRNEDFFKVVIEERKRLSSRGDLSPGEKDRLDKALKVLANSTSYGIYAEMNRQESDKAVDVTCHGFDPDPYTCRVEHPEAPGEYCFPPLASLITGAARLMLALLEHSVTELGGTYAMEDTDSMAIVATEHGGLIPCPGGPHRTRDDKPAVKALSRKQVRQISERFAALSPYDKDAVPGSILQIENDNFDPKTGKQRQLYCFAISAKRYALFYRAETGGPVLLRKGVNNIKDRWSEHGLGHLLNPTDPDSADRDWIGQVWLNMIRRAFRLPTRKIGFQDLPAVGRVSVSSPAVMRNLRNLNEGKKYPEKIKPFNFLLTCHVAQLGHPTGVDQAHFHLIAPYEANPRKWLKMPWIDQYTGRRYQITTTGNHGSRTTARVKTYGDVIREYEYHPESKCADADGNVCDKQSVGLLQRRHIYIDYVKNIGKETNNLEDVEAGMIHEEQSVYTEYPDPRQDEWEVKIRPALAKVPLAVLQKMSGLSRRMIIKARRGHTRPHHKNREIIVATLRRLEEI